MIRNLVAFFNKSELRQRLAKSSFISDSLSLSVANLLSSALNYGLLVCAAFLLSEIDFGALGAAVGILTLLTMASNAMQLQITLKVAQASSKHEALILVFKTIKLFLLIACLPTILVVIFAEELGSLISSSAFVSISLAFATITLVLSCIANGLSAGLNLLKLQAYLAALSSLVKFLFGVALMAIGCGAAGALGGYAAGFAFILAGSLIKIPTLASAVPSESKTPAKQSSVIGLLVVYGLLVCPFVLDQILVQYYNPSIGGAYAALGILGKLVFFLSAPILSVVYAHGCNPSVGTSVNRIFTLGGLGISILIFSMFFGWLLLGGLIGGALLPSHYLDVLPFVLSFFIGVAAYCLSYLATLYTLVQSNYRVWLSLVPAVIAQIILFSIRHDSVSQVVQNQLLVYFIQVVCVSLFVFLSIKKRAKSPA